MFKSTYRVIVATSCFARKVFGMLKVVVAVMLLVGQKAVLMLVVAVAFRISLVR